MIKITIRKDEPGEQFKWWVEGYPDDREIQDSDIEEIQMMLEAAKTDIKARMQGRQNLERRNKDNKEDKKVTVLKLVQ